MKKTEINEIKCTFLSLSQNESLARGIISGFLLPLDPDVEELADLRCAVSEAVTNCIVHAYAGTVGNVTIIAAANTQKAVRRMRNSSTVKQAAAASQQTASRPFSHGVLNAPLAFRTSGSSQRPDSAP